MTAEPPTGLATVAVIIGASEFPGNPDLPRSEAFAYSAAQFGQYLLDGFGLPKDNLLNLFDIDEEQPALDERITRFLQKSIERSESSPRDVIVYYVGHGYFAMGNEYFLAIRRTRKYQPYSGYPIKALAQTLREQSRHCRKFLLLDCCFAAKAVPEFQSSGPLQVAVQKTAGEFEGQDPGRGTALLCASGPHDPAKVTSLGPGTMFSTALLDVLRNGDGRKLTLYEVGQLTYERINKLFPDEEAVHPEVHSPSQPQGDIAKVPLFPTTKLSLTSPSFASLGEQSRFRNALDEATFASPLLSIQCVVVLPEQRIADDDSVMPLQEHVRRAWDYYESEIGIAAARYRAAQRSQTFGQDEKVAESLPLRPTLSCLRIEDAFVDKTSLTRAVEAMCKADVIVFDTTDFTQAGVMFLLGVRSVARRGITICSVGGSYVIGSDLAIPFNLQTLNLAAHSTAQEEKGADPRDIIGKKIVNGFRELSDLPQYLDLPAFDSVRRLGVTSNSYRPIPYTKQILFLCPFSPEYSERNWQKYLKKELPGKLREHFRSLGSTDASDPTLVRLLDLGTPRLVAQTLYESIRLTDMCIVDWTDLRPNVMFEAGVRVATNRLGAVHIIEQSKAGGDQAAGGTHSHCDQMLSLFGPVRYACKPGVTEPFKRMIESFRAILSKDSDSFESLVYRVVGMSLDHDVQPTAVPVVEELIGSANLLLSGDEESSGICPVLYHDVSNRVLEEAQEAAAERRLAAWLYLERRFPDADIRGNEQLYVQFRTLGAQARRWLKKRPDIRLDKYIKQRMQEVKGDPSSVDSRGNSDRLG